MKKEALKGEVSTTDRYVDKAGRVRFKGNKNLKTTQLLGFISANVLVWFGTAPFSTHIWAPCINTVPLALVAMRLYTWKYAAKVVELGEASTKEVRDSIPNVS